MSTAVSNMTEESVGKILSTLIMIAHLMNKDGLILSARLCGTWHGDQMSEELQETFSRYLNPEELVVEVVHISGNKLQASIMCVHENVRVTQEFELEGVVVK